jgi:hypothetical protein
MLTTVTVGPPEDAAVVAFGTRFVAAGFAFLAAFLAGLFVAGFAAYFLAAAFAAGLGLAVLLFASFLAMLIPFAETLIAAHRGSYS